KEQYARAGLEMMHQYAQFKDGSISLEAGVLEMLDRMRGGRWKVFKGANEAWLEELRTYHRDAKTGLIVKEAADALTPSRYAMMILRCRRTDVERAMFNRGIEMPNLGPFV